MVKKWKTQGQQSKKKKKKPLLGLTTNLKENPLLGIDFLTTKINHNFIVTFSSNLRDQMLL